jgi:hypothetical protein
MTHHRLEVADVFREYGQAYLEAFGDATSTEQRRVLRDLVRCRTADLGGHVEECDHCGHRQIAYNSCRNRHCPKCQAAARAQWMEERARELLPVEYFHVVFTLPDEIGTLALQNGRVIYNLLFRAAGECLLAIAADPKHLGANIGFLAVLHTWGQNLHLHPHVHCIVPGGGISSDSMRWIRCRPGFFLPVRVLRRLFRGRYLALLNAAFQHGYLKFHGQQRLLADPETFAALVDGVRQKEWVVYAKPPFGGPHQVLKYLARYTHRVAISNQRLLKIEDGKVHFHWKDYAHENAKRIMALDAVEFIRRFLLHVVPSGFVRIRHFGLLANRHRKEKLQLCRSLLGVTADPARDQSAIEGSEAADAAAQYRCPECKRGHMVVIEAIPRQAERWRGEESAAAQPVVSDTS